MLKSNSFESISGFGRLQMKSCDYFFFSGLVSRSFGLLTDAKFMFRYKTTVSYHGKKDVLLFYGPMQFQATGYLSTAMQ